MSCKKGVLTGGSIISFYVRIRAEVFILIIDGPNESVSGIYTAHYMCLGFGAFLSEPLASDLPLKFLSKLLSCY